ncbi:hypothetical protein ACIQK9_09840 [Streptomyces hydrogenans]|uniref:hypothetical protein n=1 Tax=Streptomyces hydrogenans TaxID=1873719 RepID=UPI0038011AEF
MLLEARKGEAEYGGAPLEAALAHLDRSPVLPPGHATGLAGLPAAMTARSPGARPDAAACARALADPRTAGGASSPVSATAPRGRTRVRRILRRR